MEYASLTSRIKAAVIDALLLILLMYTISEIFGMMQEVSTKFRIIAMVLLFVLYEPLFVSIAGGTVGHTFSEIKVLRDDGSGRNIHFTLALSRFILKLLLGWLSLITVSMHSQKKAIHDMVAGSLMVSISESRIQKPKENL